MCTEQEVIVELKDGQFQVIQDRRTGSAVLQHEQFTQSHRKLFSWKAQWDYLLTANWGMNIAYILPRDHIPANWWNASVPLLEMSEGFQEYSIDLSRDVRIVQDIEKVLDTTRIKTGSMRAQKAIPIGQEPFDQIENDLESVDLISGQRWSTSGFRRGFGSAKHGKLRGETYAVWVSEVLIESCRAR